MAPNDPEEVTAEDVAAVREAVGSALADAAEAFGGKRSYGRLFGICYFAEDPLSLDELVAESGYAKSTVSTAMRTLERHDLVSRHSREGEGKRVYFEAETDVWPLFQTYLDEHVRTELEGTDRTLEAASMVLDEAPAEDVSVATARVAELRATVERFEAVLDLATGTPPEELLALAEDRPEEDA